jgi:hypothetical protein
MQQRNILLTNINIIHTKFIQIDQRKLHYITFKIKF